MNTLAQNPVSSYCNLALSESNVTKSRELFSESTEYLISAIALGGEFAFPVAHHHNFSLAAGGIPTFQSVCYGQVIINKDLIAFRSSILPTNHFFVAARHKIRNLQFLNSEIGTLHLEVDVATDIKGSFDTKEYNFFPSKIKSSTSLMPLTNQGGVNIGKVECDDTCPVIAKAIYTLLEQVQKMPIDSVKPTEETKVKAVHAATRKKNNHIGELTFTPTGIKWEETENNPDPKHNFNASWSDVRAFMFTSPYLIIELKGKRGMEFHFNPSILETGFNFNSQEAINGTMNVMRLVYLYSGIIPKPRKA